MTASGLLSPVEDLILKAIFGKQQNLDVLADFLRAVLNILDNELSRLELADTNLRIDHKGDKLGVLDVKVHTTC